jgi:hypothetical protein
LLESIEGLPCEAVLILLSIHNKVSQNVKKLLVTIHLSMFLISGKVHKLLFINLNRLLLDRFLMLTGWSLDLVTHGALFAHIYIGGLD